MREVKRKKVKREQASERTIGNMQPTIERFV